MTPSKSLRWVSSLQKWIFFVLFFCTSCSSPRYYYKPLDGTDKNPRGVSGATFHPIPKQPQSFIRIESIGSKVRTGDKNQKALVLRYLFEHDDKKPWEIRASDQELRFEDSSGNQHSVFGISEIEKGTISIPAKFARVIDFSFPLPVHLDTSQPLEQFSLFWKIKTSTGPYSRQTRFAKTRVAEQITTHHYGIKTDAIPTHYGRRSDTFYY